MSAVNYKPGDKVCVKIGLVSNEIYGGWNTTDDMAESGGKVLTIREIDESQADTCGAAYRVIESPWGWTDEMLEPYIISAEIDKNIPEDETESFYEVPIEHLLNLYKS